MDQHIDNMVAEHMGAMQKIIPGKGQVCQWTRQRARTGLHALKGSGDILPFQGFQMDIRVIDYIGIIVQMPTGLQAVTVNTGHHNEQAYKSEWIPLGHGKMSFEREFEIIVFANHRHSAQSTVGYLGFYPSV